MEMLLVKDIELYRVPDIKTVMEHYDAQEPFIYTDDGVRALPLKVYQEHIRGRIFCNRKGERVCIGVTKAVGDVLGLEYEAWEKMESTLQKARAENQQLYKELYRVRFQRDAFESAIDAARAAPWWRRLMWVFTGIR